jgi:hypothetical protein
VEKGTLADSPPGSVLPPAMHLRRLSPDAPPHQLPGAPIDRDRSDAMALAWIDLDRSEAMDERRPRRNVHLFATVLGAIAGFVPAWNASRMDPVAALRYE